jgi:hypothetical protein
LIASILYDLLLPARTLLVLASYNGNLESARMLPATWHQARWRGYVWVFSVFSVSSWLFFTTGVTESFVTMPANHTLTIAATLPHLHRSCHDELHPAPRLTPACVGQGERKGAKDLVHKQLEADRSGIPHLGK